MDPVLFPAIAFGSMVAIVLGAIVFGRKTMEGTPTVTVDWRETLMDSDFDHVDAHDSDRERWEGTIDGINVAVAVRSSGDNTYTEASASIPGRWAAELTVRPSAAVGFSVLSDGFRTGDDSFDSLMATEGPIDVVPPMLDRQTREALEDGAGYSGFRVEGGTAYAWLGGLNHGDDAVPLCTALARVARCMSLDRPIEQKLEGVALDDSEPQLLRERCMHILFERYSHTAQAQAVAVKASREAADEVLRFKACSVLSATDVQPLRQFVLGARRDNALRVTALGVLRSKQAVDDELLAELLSKADALTAAAAADIARKERRTTLIAPLRVGVLDPQRGGGAAATALLELRDFGAAPNLTRALGSIGDDLELAEPYVEALSELGGIEAIAPLKALRPGIGGGVLREKIARAVEAIQKRAGNPEAGRLAVVDDAGDGGQLSVVESRSAAESGS